MPQRITDLPPLFGGSTTQTLLVIALAVNGSVTYEELVHMTDLDQSRVVKAMKALERRRVVMSYPWASRHQRITPVRSNRLPKLWDLDRANPLFRRIGILARCLARDFPTPRARRKKTSRQFAGPFPTGPYVLTKAEARLFGDTPKARMLIFLSWALNVPIEQLGKSLSMSRRALKTVQLWERYGIVKSTRRKNLHEVTLNKEFCAYWSLLEIGREIDRLTGFEFKGLAAARRIKLALVKIKKINRYATQRRLERERLDAFLIENRSSVPSENVGTEERIKHAPQTIKHAILDSEPIDKSAKK